MAYVITSDTVGLAIGPVSQTANDVHDALRKAREMYETGFANVSIKDDAGHQIAGDELVGCFTGRKLITDDLQTSPRLDV
jgi:hypothetical protein